MEPVGGTSTDQVEWSRSVLKYVPQVQERIVANRQTLFPKTNE